LSLRARASSDSIPGTWGFGLWNCPFGLSLGFGGNPFRLPALPNAVWFFHASKENYLSFKSSSTNSGLDTCTALHLPWRAVPGNAARCRCTSREKSPSPARPPVGNGFMVQTFRSPKFHPLLMLAGLAFPFSRKTTRKLLSKIIGEDGVKLGVDVTRWHAYKFEWEKSRVTFWVDNIQALESSVSPNPPLGIIIWIDNQYAAFTPEGKIGFGVLENPEPAWIEICDLEMS